MAIEGATSGGGTPGVSGVFALPFKEQIEFFRNKLHLPTERWNDIAQSAHDRGFVVAGAIKGDLLADLHAALQKHMAGGGGLEGYRKDFRNIVEKHGWHGWTGEGTAGGEAWRTRVTYMTNLRTSYAAGRYRQLTESGIKYWMWKHSGLATEPRPEHLAWSGMVLPANHPFWRLHFPPQIPPNWGCRCRVVGVASPEQARRLGGDPGKRPPAGWESVDTQHKDPALIADGWNFAPGANTETSLHEFVERKMLRYPPALRAAFAAELAAVRPEGAA